MTSNQTHFLIIKAIMLLFFFVPSLYTFTNGIHSPTASNKQSYYF